MEYFAMRRSTLPVFSLALACASALAASPKPPATPVHDVVETYHGTQVHDGYRWLEDADAAAVKQWIEAQNAYTEGVMGDFKDAKAIAERVGALALTSTQRSSPEIAANTLFYLRQTPPQGQPVLVAESWPNGTAKVLVDPNSDANGAAITNYWPSPDGKRVAYGTAEGGGEDTTIHFVDVADGKVASDALPNAGGGTTLQALLWDADDKGVTYVRLPVPGSVPPDKEQFNAALFHHTFGTAASADTIAFGKDLSPVAEYTLMSSPQAKYAAAFLHYGDGSADAVYLRKEREWKQALGTNANVRAAVSANSAAWDGERLLVIASEFAPRGKLLALDADGHSSVLVAQDEAWAMNGVAPVKGGFLIIEVNGPDWRVQHYASDGKFVRGVPLPQTGIGIGTIASSKDSSDALITYSGWAMPSHWAQYDAASGTLKSVFEVSAAADYSKVKSYRLDAKSADGTAVPVTVIALADTPLDGKRPLILSAYGGYGITQGPRFTGPYLAWLERGGAFAIANIRGGGEHGEGWHEDGMLAKKQHCFDDFHAAAQALIGAKWTDANHLGILGGSNGGLLMGAAMTQHPADYRAVVSFVGIYDMLRWELWPNGAYNTSEFGTVANKGDFDWMYKYSPLHNVHKGTAYPATLLITGINDPRVAPWQSRKFAAALQAANGDAHPIVLLTRTNEGHGVTASFSQRVGNTGAALGFFTEQLGLGPAPQTTGTGNAAAVH
jgi:prolyl oligopeptidase